MLVPVRRAVAALTLSTALVASSAALAAPAQAEKWTHADAVGDVIRSVDTLVDDEPTGATTQQPAPEDTRSDIVRVSGDHRGRALTIKVRLRAKVRVPFILAGMIKTPRKQLLYLSMRVPGFDSSTDLMDLGAGDDDVRCRGAKRTISADKRTIRLTIPRSCLGNPRWVRFGAQMSGIDPFAGDTFDDDGLAPTLAQFRPGKLSPRLRHG